MIRYLKRKWREFKARYRLDLNLVCQLSKDMGDIDYHDYYDDECGAFLCHLTRLRCVRCGKEFTI